MIDEDLRNRLLSGIPDEPGVYRFVDAKGRPLYVGKSVSLRKRVASYFGKKAGSARIRRMVRTAADVVVVPTRSEAEALLLESNLIKELKPKYNILFRDDKSYPYLRLSPHEYPRLMRYRGSATDGKAEHFGPFPNSRSVRESIDLIQKVFRLRTCTDSVFANRSRPCLLHQIGRCSAPCVGLVPPERYREDIARVRMFLQGKTDQVVVDLESAMHGASERQEYERAAALRNNIAALRDVRQKHSVDDHKVADADYLGVAVDGNRACVNISMVRGGRGLGDRVSHPENYNGEEAADVLRAFVLQHYSSTPPPLLVVVRTDVPAEELRRICGRENVRLVVQPTGIRKERVLQSERNALLAVRMRELREASQEEALARIRERLDLCAEAVRIECFDVSHSSGEETVASCVVCVDGEMTGSLYRRYRIRTAGKGDDYAAISEAVSRRYSRLQKEEAELPDLVLIDGGAGQVSAARDALADLGLGDLALAGIAKGPGRRPGSETVLAATGEVVEWEPYDPGFKLLQQVRDEAHRFAIGGHRLRRDRKRRTSSIEAIEGIGPQRRRQLLARFGGIKGLKDASPRELARIKGISSGLADRIYQALH